MVATAAIACCRHHVIASLQLHAAAIMSICKEGFNKNHILSKYPGIMLVPVLCNSSSQGLKIKICCSKNSVYTALH